jgi:hypothetical protein
MSSKCFGLSVKSRFASKVHADGAVHDSGDASVDVDFAVFHAELRDGPVERATL